MTESKRAACVCRACNARKKACDKALPACSSCTKRNLSCRYDITTRTRRVHPGRHFVALDVLGSSGSKAGQPVQQNNLPAVHGLGLSQQVLDIIGVANLAPEDISERYFQTLHERCPVISPNLFYQRMSKYRQAGGSLPADFSILLLTMHLSTMLSNPCHPSHLSGFSREQLYAKAKSLFAQAQATICTSMSLIQALLLIATSEYVCLRLEAAYISMSTCAGLARVLGLGKGTLRKREDVRDNDGVDLVQIERENVVWAIAMTERIIMTELDQRSVLLLAEFPGSLSRLPSDLRLAKPPDCTIPSSATLSCLHATSISRFGRQAQAVFLLDGVLSMSRVASKSGRTMLSKLAEADSQIRNFLAVVMDESQMKKTHLCTSVAISIRALFLLHQTTLNAVSSPQNEDEHQARRFSQAALHSACKMIIDAICTSDKKPGDNFPVCCYYNLQAAIQYKSEQRQYIEDDTAISAELDCLLSADKAYCCTLVFPGFGDCC